LRCLCFYSEARGAFTIDSSMQTLSEPRNFNYKFVKFLGITISFMNKNLLEVENLLCFVLTFCEIIKIIARLYCVKYNNLNVHYGQALSAPLCIPDIPGSNPGVGFSVFSHLEMSTGLILSIEHTLSTHYLPSVHILTVPIPESFRHHWKITGQPQ
jgi:hypothetical protein